MKDIKSEVLDLYGHGMDAEEIAGILELGEEEVEDIIQTLVIKDVHRNFLTD